jgi:hypothetical protein
MNHNLKEQIFECFDIGCINYSEIDFPENSDYTLSDFVKSESFHFDILPSFVKVDPDKGYLQNLVNPEYINENDFKLFDKRELTEYLNKYFQPFIEWDDQCDVPKLLDRILNLTSQTVTEVYLIDKKWFSVDDLRVNEREFEIYDDFLQMIWFNQQRTRLFCCIFFSD